MFPSGTLIKGQFALDSAPATAVLILDGVASVAVVSVTAAELTGTYKYTVTAGSSFDHAQVRITDAGGTAYYLPGWIGGLAGSGGGGSDNLGPGADTIVTNLTNTTTGLPVADAGVWITSDGSGLIVVAGTIESDSSGNVTFQLDDGNDYYYWSQKDGVNAVQGELFTANATSGNNFTTTMATSVVSWLYGDQTTLEDVMGTYNLEYASNQEDTSAGINGPRILRAGKWADAMVNLGLKEIYPVPLANLTDDDVQIIQNLNLVLCMAQLIFWRVIQYAGADEQNRETLYDKLIGAAKEMLDDLITGKLVLLGPQRSSTYLAPMGNSIALDSAGHRQFPSSYDYQYFSPWPWRGY